MARIDIQSILRQAPQRRNNTLVDYDPISLTDITTPTPQEAIVSMATDSLGRAAQAYVESQKNQLNANLQMQKLNFENDIKTRDLNIKEMKAKQDALDKENEIKREELKKDIKSVIFTGDENKDVANFSMVIGDNLYPQFNLEFATKEAKRASFLKSKENEIQDIVRGRDLKDLNVEELALLSGYANIKEQYPIMFKQENDDHLNSLVNESYKKYTTNRNYYNALSMDSDLFNRVYPFITKEKLRSITPETFDSALSSDLLQDISEEKNLTKYQLATLRAGYVEGIRKNISDLVIQSQDINVSPELRKRILNVKIPNLQTELDKIHKSLGIDYTEGGNIDIVTGKVNISDTKQTKVTDTRRNKKQTKVKKETTQKRKTPINQIGSFDQFKRAYNALPLSVKQSQDLKSFMQDLKNKGFNKDNAFDILNTKSVVNAMKKLGFFLAQEKGITEG